MGDKKSILLVLIILLFVLTGCAYGYGVYYFTGHCLPGSLVNGYNCSYMSEAETEALMNREAAAFVLAVEYRNNGREGIPARQVDLSYSSDGSIPQMLHDQNRFGWFLEFSRSHVHDLSRSLSYDETLLEQAVSELKCMDPAQRISPVDASIQRAADGSFVIVPDQPGTTLDPEKVKTAVGQAMLTGNVRIDLEEAGCYQEPRVKAEDPLLISNCETMNRLSSVIITLDFGRKTARVDRDVIAGWFGYDERGAVKLDEALVRSYVSSLAQAYDSVGETRSFRTYDGRNITISGGDYGWILDISGETADLMEAVLAGETQIREPVYARSGYDRESTNDMGYTYVEIDLARQKLVYYEGGYPLIETDCVTGYDTPVGVWCAGNAEMFHTLTGGFMQVYDPYTSFTEDYQGTPDITSVWIENGVLKNATVTYWMPFANVAITEGVARNIYGPEGFSRAPTTGNVEIATAQAAELFGKFVPNLPVVVY